MLSASPPGRHFSRPSRCLTCRLQGLGLARAPQRAFFNSPDNVAPSVLPVGAGTFGRLVAEAGQLGLWFSQAPAVRGQAPAFMRGVVDMGTHRTLQGFSPASTFLLAL